jgi:very-short-patch-repair endonuclease
MRERRRELRRSATPAEKALWERLKKQSLQCHKFRRQHPVGSYILDFYCLEAKVAIELDGAHHSTPEVAGYDQVRTEYLNACGIRVLRFTNEQVLETMELVLRAVGSALSRH